MNLEKTDYQNILYFINQTLIQHQDTQCLLSRLFHFDHSLLWRADVQGNMYNLEFFNFRDQFIEDYQKVHHTNDIMHPKRQLPKLGQTTDYVFQMKDLTTSQELTKSLYYQFIQTHEIIDQMVLYFVSGNFIYGGIGFARFKGETHFTCKDKEILRSLSVHLSYLIKRSIPQLPALSKREAEIYSLVVKGLTNEEISKILWISVNTVKKHLRNMYDKCEVTNRTSLIYKLGHDLS